MSNTEEYERLKSNILSLNSAKAIRTIMFASSAFGEGTSTVVSNLAIALAKNSSLKVLLIDGNLRHPALHSAFQLENDSGLSDLVVGNMDICNVLKKTELPNLSLMTAGNFNASPLEVFESPNLKTSMANLENDFNYLLLDSAPINNYPDASVLAGQMDGVILVIHAGRTRWEVAQKAKEQLQMAKANILGVVLNRRRYFIPGFLYKRL